jgi:hypothetical protein
VSNHCVKSAFSTQDISKVLFRFRAFSSFSRQCHSFKKPAKYDFVFVGVDAFDRHKRKLNSDIKFLWTQTNTKRYQIKLMNLEK